jgi:hypothetical protein
LSGWTSHTIMDNFGLFWTSHTIMDNFGLFYELRRKP